jgi:putative heme-binding domain-containing protein
MEDQSGIVLDLLTEQRLRDQPTLATLLPRLVDRILGSKQVDPAAIGRLFALLTNGNLTGKNPSGSNPANSDAAQRCLVLLAAKVQSREITGESAELLHKQFAKPLAEILSGPSSGPLYFDAALLATTWKEAAGISAIRKAFATPELPVPRRLQALEALIAAGDESLPPVIASVLAEPKSNPLELRAATLGALGRLDRPWIAAAVLDNYEQFEPELKPKAIELLTQRGEWAEPLLAAIAAKKIPSSALNVNQVQKLLASPDTKLVEKVRAQWGSVRTERNPAREKVIADMRVLLRNNSGDANKGQAVFKKICGQCHKIYGEGQDVGPDITVNGRSSFEQLLSNVFDPSLVIGAAYQPLTVVTSDGRVLTGLVAENNDQRIVLKQQGGKLETIARGDVETSKLSQLSLMPEELEKQLPPQELADLFAFITLDKLPSDPTAKRLPDARLRLPMASSDPAKFGAILTEFGSPITAATVGEGGLVIESEHAGRQGALRTHPVARDRPSVLSAKVSVPEGKKSRLELSVSNYAGHDWRLVVKGNGKQLYDSIIGPSQTRDGWTEVSVDLTQFAGNQIQLELLNQANDWNNEFGYWHRIAVISE